MNDLCPRLHMKFILFEISCPTKSWNIGIKRNENNKQICQSQVKTPMFGEKFALSRQSYWYGSVMFFSCVYLLRFRKLDWFWQKLMWTYHLSPHCRYNTMVIATSSSPYIILICKEFLVFLETVIGKRIIWHQRREHW
jgi:hypothetical protein